MGLIRFPARPTDPDRRAPDPFAKPAVPHPFGRPAADEPFTGAVVAAREPQPVARRLYPK